MNEFIAERLKLVRQLADKADPFTKIRLLAPVAIEDYASAIGLPTVGIGSTER